MARYVPHIPHHLFSAQSRRVTLPQAEEVSSSDLKLNIVQTCLDLNRTSYEHEWHIQDYLPRLERLSLLTRSGG